MTSLDNASLIDYDRGVGTKLKQEGNGMSRYAVSEQFRGVRENHERQAGADLATQVEDMLNGGGKHMSDGFVAAVPMFHRTLQQSFMRNLIVPLIRQFADMEYFDARNEGTVKLARTLIEIIDSEGYLPFI